MPVLYCVVVDVSPEAEAEWAEWNARHHVPQVLAEPGFLRATRYRADTEPGAWPRYVIAYELASREALDGYLGGQALVRLRADHSRRFGAVTRLSRLVLAPIDDVG
jgi:hypothetical protein